jgi:hypothetical protein
MFKILMGFLLLWASFAQAQSTFRGPVQLKVWRHWQQSWNVEEVPGQRFQFELARGLQGPGVVLKFRSERNDLRATIKCDRYVKTGVWSMEDHAGPVFDSESATREENLLVFKIPAANECVDQENTRIVTRISFDIWSISGEKVFSYSVVPMYVRGPATYYWKNDIPPYNAHAGSGQISVSNLFNGESTTDRWDGTLVKPVLNFVDRNKMMPGSFIGLHRHESNQEAYFMESGRAKMIVGVAARSSGNRTVSRVWDQAGATQQTEEYEANGGWLETRIMGPGEISVIVPNSSQNNNVYFHGIEALEESTFWTMGTKN